MKKLKCKKFEMLIVNLFTTIRLIGSLSLPFLYYFKGPSEFALWTMILFATDFIDGALARLLKVSTFFGAALDALADKLLNIISFLILSIEYNSMTLPLILEIAIMYTNYSTYRYGGNLQSSKIGKLKTFILDILVILSFILMCLPKLHSNLKFIKYFINNTNNYITFFSCIICIYSLITLLGYVKNNKKTREIPGSIEKKLAKKKRKTFNRLMEDLLNTDYYQKHKNESIMRQLYV